MEEASGALFCLLLRDHRANNNPPLKAENKKGGLVARPNVQAIDALAGEGGGGVNGELILPK